MDLHVLRINGLVMNEMEPVLNKIEDEKRYQ